MIGIIAAALGIISTIVAWNLNPKRRLYQEIDEIYRQLEILYGKRDEALANNDSDTLSVVTDSIVRLCSRKAVLLKRLG